VHLDGTATPFGLTPRQGLVWRTARTETSLGLAVRGEGLVRLSAANAVRFVKTGESRTMQ
jgi:hypothetical protein